MSSWGLSIYFVVGFFFFFFSILSMVGGLMLYLWDQVFSLEGVLFTFSSVDVVYEIMLDWISLCYLGTVFFISGSVMIYSKEYSEGDLNEGRFVGLMFMFVLSMMFMVLSGGMISVMLGWDGLGLVSYCLVIYYQSSASYKAGMITIMSNRIGDVLILVGIGSMFYGGSWSFLFYGLGEFSGDLWLVGCIMLVAACTKSAQVPFSAWLPEAMAAPTPVSSLVHSSTLVTAGVFLMIRFFYLLGECGVYLLGFGLVTMLLAGVGAMMEMDMKKVVAMSTLSQLGLMMFVLGVGLWKVSYFHSVMHAYFKALSFLSVGGFIYICEGNQDFRLGKKMNYVGIVINQGLIISVVCLGGFPFVCGFFSKDLILEMLLSGGSGLMMGFLFIVGLGMSIFYGMRLYMMSMILIDSGGVMKGGYGKVSMELGIFLLGICSIFVGSIGFWSSMFPVGLFLSGIGKVFGLALFFFGILYMVMGGDSMMGELGGGNFFGSLWNLQVESEDFLMLGSVGGSGLDLVDQEWVEELGGEGIYIWLKGFVSGYDFSKTINFSVMLLGFVLVMLMLVF